eukprot:1184610-Prorocentrum_minimum.AAC.2
MGHVCGRALGIIYLGRGPITRGERAYTSVGDQSREASGHIQPHNLLGGFELLRPKVPPVKQTAEEGWAGT